VSLWNAVLVSLRIIREHKSKETASCLGKSELQPQRIGPLERIARSNDRIGDYDVMTPAIWLLTRATNKVSDHQLEVAAAATGGVHYSALRDSTVRSLLDNIGGELHAQYMLTYVPTDDAAGFHNIRVTVDRSNLTIRSRPGYFPNSR
jgi:hypothetical protein